MIFFQFLIVVLQIDTSYISIFKFIIFEQSYHVKRKNKNNKLLYSRTLVGTKYSGFTCYYIY